MALWGLALTYTTCLFRVETLGRGQGRTGRATLHQCPHIPFLTLTRANDGRDPIDQFRRGATRLDSFSQGASLSTPLTPESLRWQEKQHGATRAHSDSVRTDPNHSTTDSKEPHLSYTVRNHRQDTTA